MSAPTLRAMGALLPRRLCTAASPSSPYRTPGPPVTRPASHIRSVMGPYELPDEPRPVYPKRRNPLKRTTALLDALNEEECLRMIQAGRAVFPAKIPNPRAGDLIRITYKTSLEVENSREQCFTGICMAVRKGRGGGTVVLRNVVQGVAVERGFPMYSPLVVDAEVLGRRKVRKAKLYYLRDQPLRESTFPDATKKPNRTTTP